MAVGATGAVDQAESSWVIGYSPEFARQLGDRGWIGMTWPVEAGGHGRSPLERFVVYEAMIEHGAPIGAMWFADRQVGPSLLQFGTPEQRRRFLPGIVAGTSLWCIGMSAPDAGSDPASLRAQAVQNDGGRSITGRKVWSAGAASADWCYLVTRTDPDAPRHRGLSELVVDMRSPGIEVRPIEESAGEGHACEIAFVDVHVPADHVVGAPNNSFKWPMRRLEHQRGGIDRLLSNWRLYRAVRDHAGLDTDDPLIGHEIAAIESAYRVGRLLVLRDTLRRGPRGFSAATKVVCTDLEHRVARFCTWVAGSRALLWAPGAEVGVRAARTVCYAPAYTTMGGTSEILRTVRTPRSALR